MNYLYITKCNTKSRFGLWLAHLCGLVDALIGVLSLGHVTSRLRMRYLTSDFCERFE